MYASLLLHSAKKEINEENLRSVLEAAGIQVDEIRLKATVAALQQINIDEAIKSAAAVPVAPAVAAPAAAQPAGAQAEAKPKEEEKEEEEKKEISEEDLAAGLGSLFG
ncbi:MAG: 50S ribosomal protein P1 [Fervidicoccaceae archaeon]